MSSNTAKVDTVEAPAGTPASEPAEHISAMSIMGTQCCGLHSLSGFQYHYKGESLTEDSCRSRTPVRTPVRLKSFVGAIQKAYAAIAATNKRVREANEAERMAAYRESRPTMLPHPGYVPQPEKRPALLLCTWNHVQYEPGAKSLAEQIKAAGLGECTITGYSYNGNSGNHIAAMIWAIDCDAYDKYVKENGI